MDLIIIIKFHFSLLQCSVEIHFKQCEKQNCVVLINELYHDCSTKLEIISFHTCDWLMWILRFVAFYFFGWLQSITMLLYYKIYDDSNAARWAKIIAQPFRSDSMKSFYPVYHWNAVNSLTFPTYQIIYIIWNNHSFIHIVFSNDLSYHPLTLINNIIIQHFRSSLLVTFALIGPKMVIQPVDLISFMAIHSNAVLSMDFHVCDQMH